MSTLNTSPTSNAVCIIVTIYYIMYVRLFPVIRYFIISDMIVIDELIASIQKSVC